MFWRVCCNGTVSLKSTDTDACNLILAIADDPDSPGPRIRILAETRHNAGHPDSEIGTLPSRKVRAGMPAF